MIGDKVSHYSRRFSRRKELASGTVVLILLIILLNYVSMESIKGYEVVLDKEKLPSMKVIDEKLSSMKVVEENIKSNEIKVEASKTEIKDNEPSGKVTSTLEETSIVPTPMEETQHQALYRGIFEIMKSADPKIPGLGAFKSNERVKTLRFNEETDTEFTKEYLSKFLDVKPEDLETLKNSHKHVLDNLPQTWNSELYSGNGVVYVGGGKFNWLALMSIKSLRNLGSRLPAEVLLPKKEDYEPEFCDKILPSLNAKCLVLPDILGEATMKIVDVKGYQFKSLAILVSSFQNVLLLDSDNIPVSAPDQIFKSEPFTSNGLVLWPDYWRRTTSPDFYTIAGVEVKEDERVMFGVTEKEKSQEGIPYHHLKNAIPDPTSESGQILLNKTQHFQTMILSLYYNIYGPKYYYSLLSQGAAGQGDKETFIASAVVLQNPFYQVKTYMTALGNHSKTRFLGYAIGQYDPIWDYKKNVLKENPGDRILFMHANTRKLDLVSQSFKNSHFVDGKRVRFYGRGVTSRLGYDFDLFQWDNMEYLLCQQEFKLKVFERENMTAICENIHEQQTFLENNAS